MNRETRRQGQSGKGEDELHSVVKNLVTKLCTAEDFISRITETITRIIEEKYSEKINELRKENENIMEKLQQQEDTINALVNQQKKQEQKEESRNLRLYGVPETSAREDLPNTVLDIFNNKLKLKLDDSCMEFCYRLGKKEDNKSRAIMVRLCTNYFKNLVYSNKRLLKSSRVLIREDLTKEQLGIVIETSKRVGTAGKVWTMSGKIYVKLNKQTNSFKIDNMEDIVKIFV
ncbi:hypothetical protein JTB14_026949 [Gonioctena quinquepunctata]|nr:hypothetical protein JTB14_026949 [Gonioctena quinquepunctata]